MLKNPADTMRMFRRISVRSRIFKSSELLFEPLK